LENGLFGVRRHLLLEMAGAERLVPPDLAFVRSRRAGDHAKQRRFAGTVAADETHPLPRLDLKIGVQEQRNMSVSERDVVEAK
jgi:hypothetical protein